MNHGIIFQISNFHYCSKRQCFMCCSHTVGMKQFSASRHAPLPFVAVPTGDAGIYFYNNGARRQPNAIFRVLCVNKSGDRDQNRKKE